MGVHYNVRSTNWWNAVAGGGLTRWVHIDSGQSGRVTIFPATANGQITKPILLQKVTINNSGGSGTLVVSDSAVGVIAAFKTSVAEKDYGYLIPIIGNLTIDTNGSDTFVSYVRD